MQSFVPKAVALVARCFRKGLAAVDLFLRQIGPGYKEAGRGHQVIQAGPDLPRVEVISAGFLLEDLDHLTDVVGGGAAASDMGIS